MKHRYISLFAVEMFASTFGVIWGFVVLQITLMGAGNPLFWISNSVEVQELFSWGFLVFGVIHALGINVNGRWKYSPSLRFVGMGGMASLTAYLSLVGMGSFGLAYASAGVAYGLLSVGYFILCRQAVIDQVFNIYIHRVTRGKHV